MTEPTGPTQESAPPARQPPAPAARRRRAPSFKITILGALAGFLIVFELLAHQLRSGSDPAIGTGQVSVQVRPAGAGTTSAATSSGAVVTRASGAPAASTPAVQHAAGATPAGMRPAGAVPPSRTSHGVATRSSGGARAMGHLGPRDDAYEHEGSA